jgi:hypothetical protein
MTEQGSANHLEESNNNETVKKINIKGRLLIFKCEHGRQRSQCKDCGGPGICEHRRQRSKCKDCTGSGICEHGRRKSQCKDCGVSGSKTINRGRKRKQSDSTDENIANISANKGRNFTIV